MGTKEEVQEYLNKDIPEQVLRYNADNPQGVLRKPPKPTVNTGEIDDGEQSRETIRRQGR
jgi:hypothetical protein